MTNKIYRVILEFDSKEQAMQVWERANEKPEMLGGYPIRITLETHNTFDPFKARNLFISYRRADSEFVTKQIYDRVVSAFGQGNVFIDIDKIAAGDDFLLRINEALSRTDVMLVVLGDDWDSEAHLQRLAHPEDVVRLEIETALERNVRLIPIFVGKREKMPAKDTLPTSLHPLTARNGLSVRNLARDFDNDIKGLIEAINGD